MAAIGQVAVLGAHVGDLGTGQWRLQDWLGTASYDRDGNELQSRGFYLDVPPWQCHAFSMTKIA